MSTRAYCQPQRSVCVCLHTSRDSIPCEHQLILNLLYHISVKREPQGHHYPGMMMNQDEADCLCGVKRVGGFSSGLTSQLPDVLFPFQLLFFSPLSPLPPFPLLG